MLRAFGVLAIVLLVPALPATGVREVSDTYVLGGKWDYVFSGLGDCDWMGTGINRGIVCFDVLPGESTVSVSLADPVQAAGLPVCAHVIFMSPGSHIGSDFFFDAAGPMVLPAGTTEIAVAVTGPRFAALFCGVPDGGIGGSMGTATARFA